MIKTLQHKHTGKHIIVEYIGGILQRRKDVDTRQEANQIMRQWNINATKRARNETLQCLCGTSARQARIDMGI